MLGTENTGGANDSTLVLVNDLDIRVTENSETSTSFIPWRCVYSKANYTRLYNMR